MKRLTDLLASTVSADERDAVLGDLAETDATPAAAVRDLLGLVLRRQAAQWMHPRPWLALAGATIPLGVLLNSLATYRAHNSAIYIWLYANNWDAALLHLPGFRNQLLHAATEITVSFLGLALWSWLAGYALALASRSTRHVNAAVLAVLLFLHALPLNPDNGAYGVNQVVFALPLYRIIYPLILKAVFVMLPCCLGLRKRRLT